MKKYIIQNCYGTVKHTRRARTLAEVQKWRDENLCKFQNWVIVPV